MAFLLPTPPGGFNSFSLAFLTRAPSRAHFRELRKQAGGWTSWEGHPFAPRKGDQKPKIPLKALKPIDALVRLLAIYRGS